MLLSVLADSNDTGRSLPHLRDGHAWLDRDDSGVVLLEVLSSHLQPVGADEDVIIGDRLSMLDLLVTLNGSVARGKKQRDFDTNVPEDAVKQTGCARKQTRA